MRAFILTDCAWRLSRKIIQPGRTSDVIVPPIDRLGRINPAVVQSVGELPISASDRASPRQFSARVALQKIGGPDQVRTEIEGITNHQQRRDSEIGDSDAHKWTHLRKEPAVRTVKIASLSRSNDGNRRYVRLDEGCGPCFAPAEGLRKSLAFSRVGNTVLPCKH
jgi:hypothetical protein